MKLLHENNILEFKFKLYNVLYRYQIFILRKNEETKITKNVYMVWEAEKSSFFIGQSTKAFLVPHPPRLSGQKFFFRLKIAGNGI